MSTIGEWWRRVLHRRELEGGLDEEIQFHIDHQIEKNLRQGMSASEARRQAMLRFGGIERAKESTRDEFRPVVLEDVTRDVKYGVRSLVRAPGFALVDRACRGQQGEGVSRILGREATEARQHHAFTILGEYASIARLVKGGGGIGCGKRKQRLGGRWREGRGSRQCAEIGPFLF